MAERTTLQPDGTWDTRDRAFSQGVVVDGGRRMVFVAGQAAFDEHEQVVGRGDVGIQTRKTLENLEIVLAAGGASLDDVASITVYLMDIRHMSAMQQVRAEFWPDRPPASSGIQVSALAHPDLLVEIDAVAVV